ncbi:MAG: ribosomal RNA small subunit methyltransferase A [Deltaproteobacteria bacterium]|nr:ribosomal RNA small subunit methyltransferase A [Deltaproteobacteria bacterium]
MTAKERLNLFFNSSPIYAKRSLGQNFLVSDYAIEMMLNKLKVINSENIIEIGPGPGALTDLILKLKKNYSTIELDQVFAEYWSSKGIKVFNQDALKFDWDLFENKLDSTLISNLPYQISSSIVIDRSMDDAPFSNMVLMFQKEVAQKIRAKNKTSDFSLLSLIAQTFWQMETLCDLGPRDFTPAPKVASRVLHFKSKKTEIKNKKNYLQFSKAAFKQKRKMLKSNLMQYNNLKELDLLDVMAELKISKTARAEELSTEDFVNLYQKLGYL